VHSVPSFGTSGRVIVYVAFGSGSVIPLFIVGVLPEQAIMVLVRWVMNTVTSVWRCITPIYGKESKNQLQYSLAGRMHVACRLNKQEAWLIQLWWRNNLAFTGVQTVLAVRIVFNHIHYLDTSGTCMVDWDEASLDLHAWQLIVIARKRTGRTLLGMNPCFGAHSGWEESHLSMTWLREWWRWPCDKSEHRLLG